ncbi:hypothetical protein [Kitasatospora aureofaciens]|uniref:hypothetical protein n=1 Tax=Kitasatospora aureofaciens TaxID=1894 RepID=UPI003817BBAA
MTVTAGARLVPPPSAAVQVQRGSTPHFVVSYDDSLGANGAALADAVLATCEAHYARLQHWFGGLTPNGLPFDVSIIPGSGGASHATCLATAMNCDAFDGTDAELLRMLVVAEADEVFMATAGNWDCGSSSGEGLSRVLAAECHPLLSSTARGFLSAGYWLDNGRPDFVTQTDPTDRNYLSIGCATLFLNWLRYELHYGWAEIIAAGDTTLADTYTKLTGRNDALQRFMNTVTARFPIGVPAGLTSDNAFPLELQLVAETIDGGMFHTIRHPDGSWQPFGDVKGQAGDPGSLISAAAAAVDGELHVIAETINGAMVHTIRHPDGSWQPFGDVKSQAGDPGYFTAAASACVNGELQVVGGTADGGLMHTIRHPDGSWQPFGDVKSQAGDPGHVKAVSTAGVDGELQLATTINTGGLMHTIRHPDGSWQPFGDVKSQAGDPGHVSDVSCTEVNGELQLVAAIVTGGLMHTIRHADGSWQPFGDVKGQAGDPGHVSDVSCTEVNGELQVVVELDTGGMVHTIRHPDGSWQPFGDVKGQAGDPGYVTMGAEAGV